MQHTTRFRILLVTIVIATTFIVFALGPLLTAPAPTAVSTLSADFPVESMEIPSQQGVTVHGWLARGKPGGGVLLLVHSMRSNRMEMLSRARFLKDQGYSVLFIDLQAHGETAGDHITFGLREAENVEASIAFLRKTFPSERMGAIGASLGAAAIVLAQQNLKLDAVILESLHPTLEAAVDNRLKLHFGDHGSILLPLMLWQLSFYLDVSLDALRGV